MRGASSARQARFSHARMRCGRSVGRGQARHQRHAHAGGHHVANRLQRRPLEAAWLQNHRAELVEVVSGLLRESARLDVPDEEREWLDELAIDADGDFTPASMVILGLAASELRTAKSVLALDSTRPYAVHGLIRRAEELRSAFADLGIGAPRTGDVSGR